MSKYLVVLMLMMASTASWGLCLKPTAKDGMIADTATTIVGVHGFGLVETNPLGLVGSTVLKAVALAYAEDLPKEKQQEFGNKAGAVWGATAVNNVMVILGAATPVAIIIGVISGIVFYNMPPCEENDG
jgi:hypothetical protein